MIDIIDKNEPIIAYKGFSETLQCYNSFQYEIGKEYHIKGTILACYRGFHACKNPIDILQYYSLPNSRYAKVLLWGSLNVFENKLCASDIKIVKEMTFNEILEDYIKSSKLISETDFSECNSERRHYTFSGKDSTIVLKNPCSLVNILDEHNTIIMNAGHQFVHNLAEETNIVSNYIYNNIFSYNKGAFIVSLEAHCDIVAHDFANIQSIGNFSSIELLGQNTTVLSYGKDATILVKREFNNISVYGKNSTVLIVSSYTKIRAIKGTKITIITENNTTKHITVDGVKVKENIWYGFTDDYMLEPITSRLGGGIIEKYYKLK